MVPRELRQGKDRRQALTALSTRNQRDVTEYSIYAVSSGCYSASVLLCVVKAAYPANYRARIALSDLRTITTAILHTALLPARSTEGTYTPSHAVPVILHLFLL